MASKFVRKIIKADPRKLNINMTERGDLVHSDQNEIWGHTGNHYEKLSGAVTKIDIESSTTAPHDVTINFENENSTPEGTSQVGNISLSGDGFTLDDKIIRNKGITQVSVVPSSITDDGGIDFKNQAGGNGFFQTVGQLRLDVNDFSVTNTTEEGQPQTTKVTLKPKSSGGVESADTTLKQDNDDREYQMESLILKGKQNISVKIAVPEGIQFSIDNGLHLSLTSDLFKNINVGGGTCSLTAPLLNNDNANREVYIYECQHSQVDGVLSLDGYGQNPMGKSCSSVVTFFEFMLPYTDNVKP